MGEHGHFLYTIEESALQRIMGGGKVEHMEIWVSENFQARPECPRPGLNVSDIRQACCGWGLLCGVGSAGGGAARAPPLPGAARALLHTTALSALTLLRLGGGGAPMAGPGVDKFKNTDPNVLPPASALNAFIVATPQAAQGAL